MLSKHFLVFIEAGRINSPLKTFLPHPLFQRKVIVMNKCIDCGTVIEDYFERCYICNEIRKINRNSGAINIDPKIKVRFMKQMGINFH